MLLLGKATVKVSWIDILAKETFANLNKDLFVYAFYFISFSFNLVLFFLLFCIQFVYFVF